MAAAVWGELAQKGGIARIRPLTDYAMVYAVVRSKVYATFVILSGSVHATEYATVYVAVRSTVYATFVILSGSVHATEYATVHVAVRSTVYATLVILSGIRPLYGRRTKL